MSKDAREKRNEYHRKWRELNPEKVKEYQKKHWEKKVKEAPEEESNEKED